MFQAKTKVFHGQNSLAYLEAFTNKSIWIICDPFLKNSDGLKSLVSRFDASNKVEIFTDVVPDPPIEKVAQGIQEAERVKADVMIGLGGGSAIDMAKGIYFFANQLQLSHVEEFIAIPTTSGAGSEVTNAAVITDKKAKAKYPLILEDIVPDVAILDPSLVVTVPPSVTAATGMDVLTHAIEAYVATGASNFTDALCEKSVYLAVNNLLTCYRDGGNIEARDQMHQASALAGMAFAKAGLGITHGIAHQLGAQLGLAHGLANAILMNEVIKYNGKKSPATLKKYAQLARLTGLATHGDTDQLAFQKLVITIDKLMEQMHIPKTLVAAGVEKQVVLEALSEMTANALIDGNTPFNPVVPTYDDVKKIIEAILE